MLFQITHKSLINHLFLGAVKPKKKKQKDSETKI